jgi:2-oxoglutarate dehydrogenase E1 component
LPPKPTAAPTIKLPTLPPGGPTGAPSAAPILASAPPAVAPPPKTAAPAAAAPAKAAAPATAQQPRPSAAQQPRPSAAPIVPTLKMVDKVLICSAFVASLAAVGMVTWVYFTLKNVVESFTS